jgi:chromate transporter
VTNLSTTEISAQPAAAITLWDLFTGFLLVGMLGFGGIAASGNYVIVDRRKWLTAREFIEMFGICTILPGGNVLNASVMIGDRFRGPLGSLVALSALLAMPLLILVGLAYAYDTFSYLPDVRAATAGASSAAAGLIAGTAARLATAVQRTVAAAVFATLAFVVVGVLRLPLSLIVITLVPASVALSLWRGRAR